MAEIEGKLLVCSHCGESVFLRYSGEKNDTVLDGGFTRIKHYSGRPEGWARYGEMPHRYSDMCPKCKAIWLRCEEEFLKTGVNYGGAKNVED